MDNFYPICSQCGSPGCSNLTLFVPSNSEWVASPSPSNIWAKRRKVGTGQEKHDKDAHISTVNIAVLPSLSDTTSLSSFPVYSESSTHPSSKSSSLCSLSSFMKSPYPRLQKTNIFFNSHRVPPIWTSKQRSRKWQSSLPPLEGSLFWNQFQFGCVFQENDSRVHGTRPLFRGQHEHNRKERGPHSVVWNVLKGPSSDRSVMFRRQD